ncbi:YihY/virulence factor BrkB family protein [Pleurocapsales cyanobacterium LEGE 06147]|nr:YihY/virulence factor BrkB family protein [Pleurocapsales cyanobacterium LEGE 06147]
MIQYIRSTILPSKTAQLFIQTGLKWNRDDCSGMAAALSYYTLFSLFPILFIILSVFGSLIGPNTEVFQDIKQVIERYLPPEVHDLVIETVITLNRNSAGAGIVGFGLLLFAASTVFAVLNSSVDKIWRTNNPSSETGSIRGTVLSFLANKLVAFLLVFGTALLLLTSLISNIAIKTILELVATSRETPLVTGIEPLVQNPKKSPFS